MKILTYRYRGYEFPIIKTKQVANTPEERSDDNFLTEHVSLVKGVRIGSVNQAQFTHYYINGLPVSKQLFHRFITRFLCKKLQSSVSLNRVTPLTEIKSNS